MDTVSLQDAQAHLSSLVEKAARGEAFIIAKAGKPMVKVVPIEEAVQPKKRRVGFMDGQISVPDDFNSMMADEIEAMFYGDHDKA